MSEEEIEEEIIEDLEVEIDDKDVDPRLTKAVEMLIKQTGIDRENLKGKTIPEQFDLLSFLTENTKKPKPKKTTNKNQPIVPLPTDSTTKIGRKIKNAQGDYYLFSAEEWLPGNKSINNKK